MLKIIYVNIVLSQLSFIVHKTFIIVILYVSYFELMFLPEGKKALRSAYSVVVFSSIVETLD